MPLLLLEELTGAFSDRKNRTLRVRLYDDSLESKYSRSKGASNILNIANIIGADFKIVQNISKIEIYHYSTCPTKEGNLCTRKANHVTWKTSNETLAEEWAKAITNLVQPVKNRLLVLVSPVSGTGKGLKVWSTILKVLLDQSKTDYTVIHTQRKNHARDFVAGNVLPPDEGSSDENCKDRLVSAEIGYKGINLDEFNGIVTVGGDGMLFEVLQGLHSRNDGSAQLNRLKLGTVPSGTGNGLCKTALYASGEAYSALAASFLVVRGTHCPMDLALTTTNSGKTYLNQLSMSWAMFSDMDIGSNRFRFLGPLRFELAILACIMRFRSYRAKISWLPIGEDSAVVMPPFEGNLGPNWESFEGNFLLYITTQVTHISSDAFINPSSIFGDGIMQLIFIEREEMNRFELLSWFLSLPNGTHLQKRGVHVVQCKGVRLEPLTERGLHALDGEEVEYGRIQQVILPGAANVMCGNTVRTIQDLPV